MYTPTFFDFIVNPMRLVQFTRLHLRFKVVKSEEEFLRISKERGVKSIEVDCIKYPRCIYDSPSIYDLMGMESGEEPNYTLEITATVSRGRQVVYQEFTNLIVSDKAAMTLLLLGEKKMHELRRHFPSIEVTLNGRHGPVNESLLTKLHRDARASGVSV